MIISNEIDKALQRKTTKIVVYGDETVCLVTKNKTIPIEPHDIVKLLKYYRNRLQWTEEMARRELGY